MPVSVPVPLLMLVPALVIVPTHVHVHVHRHTYKSFLFDTVKQHIEITPGKNIIFTISKKNEPLISETVTLYTIHEYDRSSFKFSLSRIVILLNICSTYSCLPTCASVSVLLAINCGPLAPPTFGTVSPYSCLFASSHGQSCSFSCQRPGYVLEGTSARVCGNDAQWTGSNDTRCTGKVT